MSALCLLAVVALLALVTCAIGVGDLAMVRTSLQVTTDATAMAGARRLGAGQQAAQLAMGTQQGASERSLQTGLWDSSTRTFMPHPAGGNAVRAAMTRRHEPWFAARWLGQQEWQATTTAVARTAARDLVFVVDVSGSMNDETEPTWSMQAMSQRQGIEPAATPAVRWIAELYDDLGFGTYPGQLQSIGETLGVANDRTAYVRLTADDGPLATAAAGDYRIMPDDSLVERKEKAYRWIIDRQLARLMPAALPAVDSEQNYDYWEKYLDYVIAPCTPESIPPSAAANVPLPPGQTRARLDQFNNPRGDDGASTVTAAVEQWQNQLGYLTYLQFMLDHGRNGKVAGRHTPLSSASADCRWHEEPTAAGVLRFPPRVQPMHGTRRALIAAIAHVKERNRYLMQPSERDRVAVVTFAGLQDGGPVVVQPLTDDYDAAMQVCAALDAGSDLVESSAVDAGLLTAQLHLLPAAQSGNGRVDADRVIVLLTDGGANQAVSDPQAVEAFLQQHASFGSESNAFAHDAARFQSWQIHDRGWQLLAIPCGALAEQEWVLSLNEAAGPRPNQPAAFEAAAVEALLRMIDHPQVRLVQ